MSPAMASAHQPRIVSESPIIVNEPEISKAYYGKLFGTADSFLISATTSFDLYVGVLVPDGMGQKTDVSAVILKNGSSTPFATLSSEQATWKPFFEPFGHDNYLQGPEYKAHLEAGEYEVRVSSKNNDSKFSLAIGETEAFDFKEGMNALRLIPTLKRDFFNESPISFVLSPMGAGFIVVMYLLAFIFGFIYRALLRRFTKNSIRRQVKNIGNKDKLVRIGFGIILLLIAISTSWSPTLLFVSGFCFFEALFSWCGLYAALGQSTCPIE